MINKVVIFYGSKTDFDRLLKKRIDDVDEAIPFLELIQHYNARLRPNESGVGESELGNEIVVKNCIVRADDYGSVLEHVVANFANIVSLNYDMDTLFVHNPPKRTLRSLQSAYPNSVECLSSKYKRITRKTLPKIFRSLSNDILGQRECIKSITSSLYRLSALSMQKPVVLLLYGPSGVGKTETAKSVSQALGGDLLRIQFSMMQTTEAYNYVFGAEHSKGSFARDLLSRETNVILIDEFDKVNPAFYNAFYELFDEGKYVDSNYEVDVKNAIFLCTCNYMSEEEIKKALGPAMYSRIGACIEYGELDAGEKRKIVADQYNQVLKKLNKDERDFIEQTTIHEWFNKNINRYDNIRILKSKLERAIFDELTETFVIEEVKK